MTAGSVADLIPPFTPSLLPCASADPELFFPLGTGPAAEMQVEEAKAVCGGCPIRLACLETALENREPEGVWGGMTADERRSLLRARHGAAAVAPEPALVEESLDLDEGVAA